jgi:hypothetical protein
MLCCALTHTFGTPSVVRALRRPAPRHADRPPTHACTQTAYITAGLQGCMPTRRAARPVRLEGGEGGRPVASSGTVHSATTHCGAAAPPVAAASVAMAALEVRSALRPSSAAATNVLCGGRRRRVKPPLAAASERAGGALITGFECGAMDALPAAAPSAQGGEQQAEQGSAAAGATRLRRPWARAGANGGCAASETRTAGRAVAARGECGHDAGCESLDGGG